MLYNIVPIVSITILCTSKYKCAECRSHVKCSYQNKKVVAYNILFVILVINKGTFQILFLWMVVLNQDRIIPMAFSYCYSWDLSGLQMSLETQRPGELIQKLTD